MNPPSRWTVLAACLQEPAFVVHALGALIPLGLLIVGALGACGPQPYQPAIVTLEDQVTACQVACEAQGEACPTSIDIGECQQGCVDRQPRQDLNCIVEAVKWFECAALPESIRCEARSVRAEGCDFYLEAYFACSEAGYPGGGEA